MADSSKKMQIVFASAECAPFVKTGGLGDVAGSLPAALVRAGAEVIVMVPKYATIKDEYKAQMEHFSDFYVSLGWRNEYCGLEKLEHDGVTYMFIDNERYFARDYPYGFFDDGERFAFFSKAITESLQHLPAGFECDILHCNDWQTALAPVFLREFYQGLPLYDRVKTVFSIHNVAFQGQFSDTVMEDILGVAHIPAAASQLRCDACSINYMLGALRYADAITTVSPTYANEIQTPEFGEGLDGVLRERSYALQGILNGIDVAGFDPATDKRIAANYTVEDRSGKAVCKAKLQEELGLEVRDDRPLMVMVTRLTRQKGLDLVMYALDRILSGGVQVARGRCLGSSCLGSGGLARSGLRGRSLLSRCLAGRRLFGGRLRSGLHLRLGLNGLSFSRLLLDLGLLSSSGLLNGRRRLGLISNRLLYGRSSLHSRRALNLRVHKEVQVQILVGRARPAKVLAHGLRD